MSSRVSFSATSATVYSIVVANKSEADLSATGSFRLSWYPTPPPGFTGAHFSPPNAIPGAKVLLTGTNLTGATAVLFNGASASFSVGVTNNLDLRLTAIVPPDATSGPITVLTPHGNVTSSVSFEVLPPPLAIRRTPEDWVEISWPATGNGFVLEFTEDLGSLVWETHGTPPEIAQGHSKVLASGGGPSRYFRLRGQR